MTCRAVIAVTIATVVMVQVIALKNTAEEQPMSPVRSKRAATTAALGERRLMIVTMAITPYTIITNNNGTRTFTGFIPDIIKRLSVNMRFRYDLFVQPDHRYGSQDSKKRWNGMIGDLIKTENNQSGGADLAAADLTITSEREQVVDFVKPFQHIGLTMLMKKPNFDPETQSSTSSVFWPYDFNILMPLTAEVWGLVFLFIVLVGVLLWLINHFNPYEWSGRHNAGLATEEQAESFNLQGSLWFVLTSLQWQGFERAPRSLGAKVLTVFWFAFVTLVLVTYTASLVNHLFWASMVQGDDPTEHPVKSLADLVSNNKYSYGCLRGGSTYSYIVNAARLSPEFQVMRDYWLTAEGEKQIYRMNSLGVERVRRDPNYAFIMESSSAKYLTLQRPCDLMTAGEKFALRSFGFALPKNSPYLEDFHRGILMLAESGEIEYLEQQWWGMNNSCWNVTQAEKATSDKSKLLANKPKRITLHMFLGPLVIISVGVVLAIIVTITEVVFYKYRGSYQSSNRPQGQVLKMDPDEGNI